MGSSHPQQAEYVRLQGNRPYSVDQRNDRLINCCGISFKQKPKMSWEESAKFICLTYKERVEWATEIINLLTIFSHDPHNQMLTFKYKKQFNDIRLAQEVFRDKQKQTQLTDEQLDRFRRYFRNSVLTNVREVLKTKTKMESIRQNMKIITNMDPNPPKNLKAERVNAQQKEIGATLREKRSYRKSFLKSSLIAQKVSLIDDSMSFIFRQQQQKISKSNMLSLQIFIKYSMLLQKHLKDTEHQIYNLILCFKRLLREFEKSHKNYVSKQEMDELVESIKIFIIFITEVVQKYYGIEEMQVFEDKNVGLICNYQNLLTIVTTILFKDQKFYNLLFNIVKEYNKEEDQLFSRKFKSWHGKPPETFFVKKEYCINKFTNYKSQDGSIISQKGEDLGIPYQICSQILLKITKTKAPIAKMKTILQCAENITHCISGFYNNNQKQLKKNMLDADQVLAIFSYILSISQIQCINSHMFIIDNFATESQKISITGYYFSVLSCAIRNFCTTMEQKVQKEESIQQRESSLRSSSFIEINPSRQFDIELTVFEQQKKQNKNEWV